MEAPATAPETTLPLDEVGRDEETKRSENYEERLHALLDTTLAEAYADPDQTVEKILQTNLDSWRGTYAEAIADNSAATFGVKVKNSNEKLSGRTTKKNLEVAGEQYQLHVDALGVLAAQELRDAGADDQEVRELGILGTLGKLNRTEESTESLSDIGLNDEDSEAAKLAAAVETTRLQKAGFIDADGNEITKGLKGLYNKFTKKWAAWSEQGKKGMLKKTLTVAAVGGVATIAGAATGGIAAAGVVGGVIAASRATATTKLSNRANITKAADENISTMAGMQSDHAATEVAGAQELVEAFSGASNKNLRKNRIRAGVAAVATTAAVIGGDYLHPLLDHGVHSLFHPNEPGLHPAAESVAHTPSASPSASATAHATPSASPSAHATPSASSSAHAAQPIPKTAGQNPVYSVPSHEATTGTGGAQTPSGTGGNVVDVNPNSSDTVYGAFDNAHVNVHDWYNAMDAAEKAGQLHEHIMNGDPNDFTLTTANGSSNHAAVIDTILNHMPSGKYEDTVTHHISNGAGSKFGGVTPFAQQTAHHVAGSAHQATGHVAESTQQQAVDTIKAHSPNAHINSQTTTSAETLYHDFAQAHGGESAHNAKAFEAALRTAITKNDLKVDLTHNGSLQYFVHNSHHAWEVANMHQVQTLLAEEAKQDGYTLAA